MKFNRRRLDDKGLEGYVGGHEGLQSGLRVALFLSVAVLGWQAPAHSQDASAPSTHMGKKIDRVDVDSVDPLDALNEGFNDIYARADATGLKVPLEKVDTTFLEVEVDNAWEKGDPSRVAHYEATEPPAIDGVVWPDDKSEAWMEFYQNKASEALEAGDRADFRAAMEDFLYLASTYASGASMFGVTDDRYIAGLGQLVLGLDPSVTPTEDDISAILQGDASVTQKLRREVSARRAALPPEERTLLLSASAEYLALKSSEGQLSGNDNAILEQRADLLEASGDIAGAERLSALVKALERNANIDQYNAMLNYRQQNVEINAFDTAATWDLSGLKAARAFMVETDPKLLRYSLLVAADGIAGGKGDLAEEAIQIAQRACVAQACGSIEKIAPFQEAVGILQRANLASALDRFRSTIAGTGSATDPRDQELMALQFVQGKCYANAELDKRGGPTDLTTAGELTVARCDLEFGRKMLAIREARGETALKAGDYRSLVEKVGEASFRLGDWNAVAATYTKLYPMLRAEREAPIELSIASALLAEAQIALKDFAGADATLKAKQADADRFFAEGSMLPLHYRNELVSIASLRVSRLLADNSRAAEAYELASDLADRDRAFREGLSGSVYDSTVLNRSLRFAPNHFTNLLDAAFAMKSAARSRSDAVLAAAFSAAQDASLDPTSIAIGMSAGAEASVSGNSELAGLIQRRRILLDELAPEVGVDAKATFALGSASAAVERTKQAEVTAKVEEYETIDKALREQFPDYFNLVRPRALAIDEARALMRPDEATLLVIPTERGVHTMIVTREGVTWNRAPVSAQQLSDTVDRLLWFAGSAAKPDPTKVAAWEGDVDGGRRGFDRKTAFALYQQLIAPHRAELTGKRKLYISAKGALASLPLGLLVTERPEGKDDDLDALSKTHWLADELIIAQLPSLQSLAFLRRGGAESGSSLGFVGIGDPVLSTAQANASRGLERVIAPEDIYGAPGGGADADGNELADVAMLRQLPELEGTGRELRAMAEALSAGDDSLMLRAKAQERAVKALDLSSVAVLAFATHGLLAGELRHGQSPGLVLTPPDVATEIDDGLLTAPEIARLHLSADWVILSACNTAAGDGSDGSGALSGLARAFFNAGARSLLVSHWPVYDDLAAILTVRAVSLQRADASLSRGEAFQQAQQEIRSQARWAHPRAWAPFAFIGDASATNPAVSKTD